MSRKTAAIFTGVFLVTVVIMGVLSAVNLADHYLNHTVSDNEWVPELGSKFETDIAASFFRKFSFVSLNGAVRRVLGQREMNGVVKLNNGYLTTPLEQCPDEILRQFAGRTAALNDYLAKRGTFLLYVSPPYTTGKYDPELPEGIEDFSNDNMDRMNALLEEAGIDVIDIREAMYAGGLDHYKMMYKTDHHWTTEAGFYAYGLIEDYIREKTGCGTDPLVSDPDQYEKTEYKNVFLGSRGNRTGIWYAGTDDFTLILPKFETHIRKSTGEEGSIRDLFINMEPLDHRERIPRYIYDDVLGGPAYLGDYVNTESKNDVKIMIITDSFSKAVNPYLIMNFREVNCIVDSYVGGITPELIEDYDPDVVILMYYPKYINSNSGSFDFSGF